MKVLFPSKNTNPYQTLLSGALGRNGIEVVSRTNLPSCRWLFKHRHSINVLHFHWLTPSYYRGKYITLRVFILLRFVIRLILSKIIGYRIVWTVHNIMPHEKKSTLTDYFVRFCVVWSAAKIIVHCGYAGLEVKKNFLRKNDIIVIPHGNFIDVYPKSKNNAKIKIQSKINKDKFIYLYFGQIRPYKGVKRLIKAFENIADTDSLLIIAGECQHVDKEEIQNMIMKDDRIIFLNYHIADNEVSELFAIADCLVAPFSKILTSGSIILGLSYGIPVIAPNLGCIPETISEDLGVIYNNDEETGLIDAMKSIREKDIKKMSCAALKKANELKWDKIAIMTKRVYQDI